MGPRAPAWVAVGPEQRTGESLGAKESPAEAGLEEVLGSAGLGCLPLPATHPAILERRGTSHPAPASVYATGSGADFSVCATAIRRRSTVRSK
jgi:hypothetical protein